MVEIRNYKDSDYQDVKKNLEDANIYDPLWDSRDNLRKRIEGNPGSILVAAVNNQAVGNVYISEDAFLFRLAVCKEYRGKGIGKLLLEEAERRLEQLGFKQVSIFVEDKNEELKTWYTSVGYVSTKSYRFMYKVL